MGQINAIDSIGNILGEEDSQSTLEAESDPFLKFDDGYGHFGHAINTDYWDGYDEQFSDSQGEDSS